MKTTHIIILVLIAASIAVLVQYSGDLTTYETIASAREKEGKHVNLIAKIDKGHPIEYDAAKNEQARVEGRIKELEYKLEHSRVMDGNKDTVSIGSTVTVKYVDDDETEVYKIVGSLEADPFQNKISNESPIGIAIFGKKVGDIIDVKSPNGSYQVQIVKIA